MRVTFDPRDWYWVVAGSTTEVYSSAIGDYVSVDDATYQSWLAVPQHKTRPIASEAELADVLVQYALVPNASAILDAYKGKVVDSLPVVVLLKVVLNHENRIRALEGKGAITAAQMKAAIKQMI